MTKRLLALALIMLPVVVRAQNVEKQLKRVAHDVDFAVLPVWYSPEGNPAAMQVVGTAFLVTPDGYFITAAHVLEFYRPKSAQLTVGLRQRSGDTAGVWFEVLERDETHDLALCKTYVALGKFKESKDNPGAEQPVASLRVSATDAVTGTSP